MTHGNLGKRTRLTFFFFTVRRMARLGFEMRQDCTFTISLACALEIKYPIKSIFVEGFKWDFSKFIKNQESINVVTIGL